MTLGKYFGNWNRQHSSRILALTGSDSLIGVWWDTPHLIQGREREAAVSLDPTVVFCVYGWRHTKLLQYNLYLIQQPWSPPDFVVCVICQIFAGKGEGQVKEKFKYTNTIVVLQSWVLTLTQNGAWSCLMDKFAPRSQDVCPDWLEKLGIVPQMNTLYLQSHSSPCYIVEKQVFVLNILLIMLQAAVLKGAANGRPLKTSFRLFKPIEAMCIFAGVHRITAGPLLPSQPLCDDGCPSLHLHRYLNTAPFSWEGHSAGGKEDQQLRKINKWAEIQIKLRAPLPGWLLQHERSCSRFVRARIKVPSRVQGLHV